MINECNNWKYVIGCTSGADGTFDILKYADPDLDLGSDNKTIFDDLVEDVKPQDEDKKAKKEDAFSDVKSQMKTETDSKHKDFYRISSPFLSFFILDYSDLKFT